MNIALGIELGILGVCAVVLIVLIAVGPTWNWDNLNVWKHRKYIWNKIKEFMSTMPYRW